MVVVVLVVVVDVVVCGTVVEVVVVVSGGRVVVDEVVVVVGGRVVVVVVVVVVLVVVDVDVVVVDVVVVAGAPFVVNASSGTISQPAPLIFQASIMQVSPPFSYIHSSKGWLPDCISNGPDSVAAQFWSFQIPNVLPSIVISPPSSDANQNSIVLCSGIVINPVMWTMNKSPVQSSYGSPL